MALDRGPKRTDAPVEELVAEVLACRATLAGASGSAGSPGSAGSRGRGRREPADVIGDALAYDVALVRLCDRLAISHELAGDQAGPAARRRAEERLAERFPGIAAALVEEDPGLGGSES